MAQGALSGKRILGVFAHPDDETYSLAGCMARYRAEGCEVTILTFTRGEAGQISEGAAATRETLGEVREAELREACKIAGVTDVRIVGTPDGGTQEADEGVQAIVDVLRELEPDVLVTMEPEGITRHPDHVALSAMTARAFEAVRDEGFPKKFYLNAEPAASMAAMEAVAAERGLPWWSKDDPLYPRAAPDQSIACIVDVTQWLDVKVAALQAHRTQAGEFIGWLPEDLRAMTLGAEAFQRAYPPKQAGEIIETDLFAGLRGGR